MPLLFPSTYVFRSTRRSHCATTIICPMIGLYISCRKPLYAITMGRSRTLAINGGGGLSSAVGEMAVMLLCVWMICSIRTRYKTTWIYHSYHRFLSFALFKLRFSNAENLYQSLLFWSSFSSIRPALVRTWVGYPVVVSIAQVRSIYTHITHLSCLHLRFACLSCLLELPGSKVKKFPICRASWR